MQVWDREFLASVDFADPALRMTESHPAPTVAKANFPETPPNMPLGLWGYRSGRIAQAGRADPVSETRGLVERLRQLKTDIVDDLEYPGMRPGEGHRSDHVEGRGCQCRSAARLSGRRRNTTRRIRIGVATLKPLLELALRQKSAA